MNEAMYRKLNEGDARGRHRQRDDFLCECAAWRCNELMRLTRAKDKTVRSNSRRFATVSGHDIPDVEDVVEHHEALRGHRKHPDVDDVVKATDPRRPLED